MKRILFIATTFFLCFFLVISQSQATAISDVSGSITVDWNSMDSVRWDSSDFQFNGADANNGSTSTSDYPGEGVANAEAALGPNVIGSASTSEIMVSSNGYLLNNGSGFSQNASGTSHLTRSFTIDSDGNYSFSALYSFFDSISLTDPSNENASAYNHACLFLWANGEALGYIDQDTGEAVGNIDYVAFYTENNLSESGSLSLSDIYLEKLNQDGSLIPYALELHTYNSATAFSPSVEQPIPEPTTIMLFGIGLLGMAGVGRKKK